MLIDYEIACPRSCRDCRHYVSGVQCHAFVVIPPEIFGDAEAHNTVQDGQQGNFVVPPTKEAKTPRFHAQRH